MSTSSDKQDPVLEARELLSQIRLPEDADSILHALFADAVERQTESPFWGRSKPIAEAYARTPDLLSSLCNKLEELRAETLKGICVYCGYIEQYESLEQKSGDEGNRMRVEHIKQCPERPELKLIAELERLEQLNATQSDSIKALHEQEKKMRDAIDAGLVALELLRQWVGPPPTGPYDFDSLREDGWKTSTNAMKQMRAAITPKEKPDSQKEAKQQ